MLLLLGQSGAGVGPGDVTVPRRVGGPHGELVSSVTLQGLVQEAHSVRIGRAPWPKTTHLTRSPELVDILQQKNHMILFSDCMLCNLPRQKYIALFR